MPQDSRLFCTQILIALASSPLSWTGKASGRFALVGYSLGGGIAATFTSISPDLVSSLVLIAPSGLLRPNRVSLRTWFLYSHGILPEPILRYLVRERLRGSVIPARSPQSGNEDTSLTEPIHGEVPRHETCVSAGSSQKKTAIDVASVVQFQVKHHRGFVQAYMSSMRYGPIMSEHATWKCIGQRLSKENKETKKDSASNTALDRGKVLIICANEDTSIVTSELMPDATAAFEGNVEFRHFDAGHEVPMSKSREVANAIWEFWSS